jgi:hypothetical protein
VCFLHVVISTAHLCKSTVAIITLIRFHLRMNHHMSVKVTLKQEVSATDSARKSRDHIHVRWTSLFVSGWCRLLLRLLPSVPVWKYKSDKIDKNWLRVTIKPYTNRNISAIINSPYLKTDGKGRKVAIDQSQPFDTFHHNRNYSALSVSLRIRTIDKSRDVPIDIYDMRPSRKL